MLSGKVIDRFELDGNKIVLRYPKLGDVDVLMRIINSLVKERALIHRQKKIARKDELKWLRGETKKIEKRKEVMLVAEMNGKIVGYTMISKGLVPSGHVGLFGIGLLKGARGIGLGEKLTKAVIDEAVKRLNVKILKLEVFSSNEAAYNLYRKMGFEESGRIRKGINYYGKYLDEITMVKYLNRI